MVEVVIEEVVEESVAQEASDRHTVANLLLYIFCFSSSFVKDPVN